MAHAVAALGFILALAPAAGTPPATGTYVIDGAPFAFQDAVAFRKADWEGPGVAVVLLEKPLDHAALAQTLDVEGTVEAAKESASWVQLDFKEDGTWRKARYNVRSAHGASSGSKFDGAFASTMKAQVHDGRVAGRVRAAFAPDFAIDLTLAVPVAEPPAGTALPADGGAPGLGLRACSAAFAKHSLPDLQRACSANLGDIVSSSLRMKSEGTQVDDPWAPAGAGECEVAAVSSLAIDGGVMLGDQARVHVTGGWTEGRRCAGDVFLRRENGAWRVSASRLQLKEQ